MWTTDIPWTTTHPLSMSPPQHRTYEVLSEGCQNSHPPTRSSHLFEQSSLDLHWILMSPLPFPSSHQSHTHVETVWGSSHGYGPPSKHSPNPPITPTSSHIRPFPSQGAEHIPPQPLNPLQESIIPMLRTIPIGSILPIHVCTEIHGHPYPNPDSHSLIPHTHSYPSLPSYSHPNSHSHINPSYSDSHTYPFIYTHTPNNTLPPTTSHLHPHNYMSHTCPNLFLLFFPPPPHFP